MGRVKRILGTDSILILTRCRILFEKLKDYFMKYREDSKKDIIRITDHVDDNILIGMA